MAALNAIDLEKRVVELEAQIHQAKTQLTSREQELDSKSRHIGTLVGPPCFHAAPAPPPGC